MRASRHGFTLIELMIVIVIIGITLGYVGPRIYGGLSSSGMERASRDISAMLQLARSWAITQHRVYLVRFDLERNQVAVYERPETSGVLPDPLKERRLPEGVRIRSIRSAYQPSVQEGSLDLRITAEGVVEQGLIYLEDGHDRIYTLEIKPFTGTLRVYDSLVEKVYG